MTNIVFVHGWGFEPSFWKPLADQLVYTSAEFIDMGFFGSEQTSHQLAIYITHSMGLVWTLQNVPDAQAIIAINGFTKFTQAPDWEDGVEATTLKRMIRGFRINPEYVWQDFMTKAGGEATNLPENSDLEKLSQGLKSLQELDGRTAWSELACPKCVISSREDQIVPQKLTETSFLDDEICYIKGDHLLPLHSTDAVATHIQQFLDSFTLE